MNTNILKMIEQAEVVWKPLGDIAILQRGRVISKTYLEENKGIYPVYSSQTQNNGEIGRINTFDFDGEFLNWTTDGANAGTIFYRNGKFSITNVSGLIRIKSDSSIIYKFLYYWLLIEAKKYVYSGMGNPKLMSHQIEKIQIPIPPLELQKEIVKRLDILTELEATLEATLEAELSLRKKQYQYYRDFLLSESELAKVGFEWKRLGEIADICLGLTYTPTYVDSGVKFISAQNTSGDFLDLSNVKYISEEEYERSTDNAKPKRGDVLFTRVGSNLGHPVIVETDEKLCIFVSLGFLRPKNRHILFNRYLKHWMTSDFFWEQVNKNVHGSAKVNLNTGWLKNFLIPLPVIDIQIKIAEILDKFDRLTSSITDGLPKEIELRRKQYEYYRELLLGFSQS